MFSVGDTVWVAAEAHADGPFVGTYRYSTVDRPKAFAWSVTPRSAASMVAGVRLAIQGPGPVLLSASTDGVVGSAAFAARPPAVFVSVQAPSSARLGDTVTVRFDARDKAGAPLRLSDRPLVSVGPAQRMEAIPTERGDEYRGIARGAGRLAGRWCLGGRVGEFYLDVLPS